MSFEPYDITLHFIFTRKGGVIYAWQTIGYILDVPLFDPFNLCLLLRILIE